jgi:cytochrome P450
MDTFHKEYLPRRKSLSAAFFKEKLARITLLVKEEAMEFIKEIQGNKITEIDILEFWSTMQCRIFTSISVGRRNANVMINYEHPDGRIEKWLLGDVIKVLLNDTLNRALGFPYLLFPGLLPYLLKPSCRHYYKNVMSVRNAVQRIIDDRRSGLNKGIFEDGDLLSILLSDSHYSGDDEKTKDELIFFFIAGNETVKSTSTNTTCFLTMYPEIKAKLMAELLPELEPIKDDFVGKLTTEVADRFDYLRRCWYETMRLQAPTPNSTVYMFAKPVTMQGVEFTPTTNFVINFDAIHTDPREWQSPEVFEPDRFDSKSSWYLRPDGKQRNTYSFCPFFGGKRICLGKTLAESLIIYTLPLVLYHFDFEFVNSKHKTKKPNF